MHLKAPEQETLCRGLVGRKPAVNPAVDVMAADVVEQVDGACHTAHGEKRHAHQVDRPRIPCVGNVAREVNTGPARGK